MYEIDKQLTEEQKGLIDIQKKIREANIGLKTESALYDENEKKRKHF